MNGMEGLARRPRQAEAAFGQDADQVHHRIGALHRAAHGLRIAQVSLHGMDLPHRAHRLQMAGKVGPARSGADAPAVGSERPHRVAAEKARAAKYGHQASLLQPRGHYPTLPASTQLGLKCDPGLAAQAAAVKPPGPAMGAQHARN
jgi:hypothetical protein